MFATLHFARPLSNCSFPANNTGIACSNLIAQKEVSSKEQCINLCCNTSSCAVWQWCTNSDTSTHGCGMWHGIACHIGQYPSGSHVCHVHDGWIGGSKTPLPGPNPGPHPGPHPGPPGPSPKPPKPAATRKQGFSGYLQDYSCDDQKALGLSDSWYYTWTLNSCQYNKCKPAQQGAEFVPMINGVGQVNNGVTNHFKREWQAANAHYLLGYNEPDPGNGHNHPHRVAPKEAAKDWVFVQQVAEELGLALVSPAVSTTGLDDQGVSPWFDQFFGNCTQTPGCNTSKIQFIAFHDYGGNVSKLLSRANGLMQRYGKQTWITEFAINKWARIHHPGGCDNCNITRAMQDAYMKEVLPALDKSPAVYRYVWYTARDKPVKDTNNGNLLAWNISTPTLTSTGEIYKAHAQSFTNRKN